MTIEASDLASRGYALAAKIAIPTRGTATVFANTPVAIVGIVAVTVLAVSAMRTQEHWRLQAPELALTEGDGDRPRS